MGAGGDPTFNRGAAPDPIGQPDHRKRSAPGSRSQKVTPNWAPPSLAQPHHDYRYSTDAWLLGSFSAEFIGNRWCDLGSGCGVIAFRLAGELPDSHGIAIELQPSLSEFAVRNLREFPVTVVQGDLRTFPWKSRSLDLVVCNPPFYEVGAGHINKNPSLAKARHTFHGNVIEFAKTLSTALKPEGHFCFIYPYLNYRNVAEAFTKEAWVLRKKLYIHSFANREPKLVCMAWTRGKVSESSQEHLNLYQSHRIFTQASLAFLSFNRSSSMGPV